MNKLLEDRTLIKIKDVLLILTACTAAFGWANKFYTGASELPELRIRVERHETQLAVINAQYAEIIRRLDQMENR